MPGHEVTTERTKQHVRIEIDGRVVAETDDPIVLHETHLPDRFYIPPQDVRFEEFEATDLHTRCPYKGIASYWSARDGEVQPNVAWAYPNPLPDVSDIKDHVAFYNEAVEIVVDGVKQ